MNRENTKKIVNDFPEMFFEEGRGPRRPSTMMGNHIYCGDGWFDIIYNLCTELSPMRAKVLQIKEKFGGLRFYCSFPKDYSEKGSVFIRAAEAQAMEICETCGDSGEFRIHHGWRMVSCEKCHEDYCKEHPEDEYSNEEVEDGKEPLKK